MVSLQSITWVFLLNSFSRVINLLLTKLARDRTGRISALGLFCTDRALSRLPTDILPVRPSRLVNKIYIYLLVYETNLLLVLLQIEKGKV